MAWRGENKVGDRIWSLLPYMMPIADAMTFAVPALKVVPGLKFILFPLYYFALPFAMLQGVFSQFFGMLGGFLVFILLFVTVVRNPRIGHFIRFNTAQAIIIGVAIAILRAVLEIFRFPFTIVSDRAITDVSALSALDYGFAALGGAIFFVALGVVLYSMVSVVQGKYADVPVISEASYSQVR
jgi:hypothetical protein